MIFLDTKTSGAKDVSGQLIVPDPSIPWVGDFKLP